MGHLHGHVRFSRFFTRPLAALAFIAITATTAGAASAASPPPAHRPLQRTAGHTASFHNARSLTRFIDLAARTIAAADWTASAPDASIPKAASVPAVAGSADRYIPIGTAVNLPDLDGANPLYPATLDANFTSVTPENEMKWDTTEPEEGVFNFGPADQIVQYALAHGMSVRGHNLVWDQQLPTWLTSGTWTADQLEAILKQHIQTEVSHFAGEVHEWDVINEPFNNNGTLQDNIWLQVIGPDYIPLALEWAHEADPTAKLFINDYNTDWPGPKERAMVSLAHQLLAAGVPLNGIGMEEHLSLRWYPSARQLATAMSDYASLGLEVEVTEADVNTTGYAGGPQQAEAAAASVFSELASTCRAQPACVRFSVWGVSDAVSWLGASASGLPFDTNYLAKPAWAAILAGLANPVEP